MAWSASIRVVDEDGDPVHGARVTIDHGWLTGIDSKYTDVEGWAEFSYESIEKSELWVTTIWIEGDEVAGGFYMSDGDTRSYTR